jgi:small-conductance mechanosensitive channel
MAPMNALLHLAGFDPDRLLFGNPLADWAYALGLGLATFAALLFVRRQIAKRTRGLVGRELPPGLRLALVLARRTKLLPLLAASLGAGSKYLDLAPRAEKATTAVIVIMVVVQIGLWASAAVRFYLEEQSAHTHDRRSQTMVTIVQFVANVAIWSIVLLLALDNLGFQVKALLAGLGIGGIAVALAVQNVLGDLLASVSIALDKPFEVGDTLVLEGGYTGAVEAIGIKSTRLRSISGEQIIVANAELTRARIRNYGRILERRLVFRFQLAYGTPAAAIAEVPEMVRAAVATRPEARFERAHLMALGPTGFDFEVAYRVPDPDYAAYLAAVQAINLALLASLEQRGIALSTLLQPR